MIVMITPSRQTCCQVVKFPWLPLRIVEFVLRQAQTNGDGLARKSPHEQQGEEKYSMVCRI